MNSAVITKIEYQLDGQQDFSEIEIIPHSAKMSEDHARTRAGDLHKTNAQFNIAKVCPETDSILLAVKSRRAQFRITDANGVIHLVGSTSYPARLSYEKGLDGSPGSFNGYRCLITCSSPVGSSAS
ncbi:hypothetical protein [uncultured Sunxiuqinia sp.]|uniref:hypothetical protein n=1 Tax=uncultured Sunxiuqinia sp. TaxID=1573825 RepID=UPI002629E2BE|nr:hypothetical protein [uncultured Sunxiuqinia sp.]